MYYLSLMKGVISVVTLVVSTLSVATTSLLPGTLLLLVPIPGARHVWRLWSQLWQELWFPFACGVVRCMLGIEIYLHVPKGGLEALRKQLVGHNVVLICNHRTCLDWMFLWALCLMTGRIGSMKIALRNDMKMWPGCGWAMQCFGFVFLSRRNREADLVTLANAAKHHCKEKGPGLTLMLFPEGTDLSPSNIKKNHEFAKEKGLELYNEVLHPKLAGFRAVVSAVKKPTLLLDTTVGYVEYTPGHRPIEKDLVTGQTPQQVHIRIESVRQCPEPDDAEDFLKSSFADKEQLLRKFSVKCPLGRPDVSVFARDRETVSFLSAEGTAFRVFLGWFVHVPQLIVQCWAIRYKPGAGYMVVCGFAAWFFISAAGGVDSLERWHARQFPTQ